MTLQEAKELSRWWNQNHYKYKHEGIPANVAEALRILESGSTTASAVVKVLNGVPPTFQPGGFVPEKHEPETVVPESLAKAEAPAAKAIMRAGKEVTQDEYTARLAELAAERKTATPKRLLEIESERGRIYTTRLMRKRKKKAEKQNVAPFSDRVNSTKIPQKPVNLVFDTPNKPAALPEKTENTPAEIPQKPTEKLAVSPVMQWLQLQQEVAQALARAEAKHPNWPASLVKQGAIICEESGELIRAILQHEDEGGSLADIRKEALHTIATCLRLLKSLPE